MEYITQAEAAEARELLVNENEQKYETSVEYAETDQQHRLKELINS